MSACPYCLTDCGHPETCGAELDEQPSAWRRLLEVAEPEHHIEPPC